VQEGPARVHDVRDITVLLIPAGRQQRRPRVAQDARRVIEVEQERADGVDPHRTDAVGEHQPALIGLDRRPAVPDLEHFPRLGRCPQEYRLVPHVTVRRAGQAGALAVGAAQGEVASVHLTREQRHALVPGGRPGQPISVEYPQVGAGKQARGDPPPVVGGVGGAVFGGPVIVGEPREPRVLHAIALLLGGRRQDPLPEVGFAGKGGVIGRGDCLPQQVDRRRGTRPGQQVAVSLRQRPLEIGALELGGKRVQRSLSEFVKMALVSENCMKVRPAPPSRRCIRRRDRQQPRLEGPLRTRTDDGRAEADRGDVPLTDTTDAERHPDLARLQAPLVRA
jgi:hypothetical protein